jgi:hypothetical protein
MYLAKMWDVSLEMRKKDNTPQSLGCGVSLFFVLLPVERYSSLRLYPVPSLSSVVKSFYHEGHRGSQRNNHQAPSG